MHTIKIEQFFCRTATKSMLPPDVCFLCSHLVYFVIYLITLLILQYLQYSRKSTQENMIIHVQQSLHLLTDLYNIYPSPLPTCGSGTFFVVFSPGYLLPSLSLMEPLNLYELLPESSATCSIHVYSFLVRPVLVCPFITCPFLVCLLTVSSLFG